MPSPLPFTGLFVAGAAVMMGMNLPESLTGAKIGFMFAGLIGGIISLGVAKHPSIMRAGIAVLAGAATGFFFAPIVASYLSLSEDEGLGVALLAGFVGFPFFVGVHALAIRWGKDPVKLINEIRSAKDD